MTWGGEGTGGSSPLFLSCGGDPHTSLDVLAPRLPRARGWGQGERQARGFLRSPGFCASLPQTSALRPHLAQLLRGQRPVPPPALPVTPFASLPGLWTDFGQIRAAEPLLQGSGGRGDCCLERLLRWGLLVTVLVTRGVFHPQILWKQLVGEPPPHQRHPLFTPGTRRRAGGPAASSGGRLGFGWGGVGWGRGAPQNCQQEWGGSAESQSRAPNKVIFQRKVLVSPPPLPQASRPPRADRAQAGTGGSACLLTRHSGALSGVGAGLPFRLQADRTPFPAPGGPRPAQPGGPA